MEEVKVGDRVEFVSTLDPCLFLEPGVQGTVVSITELSNDTVIRVQWDNGSVFALLPQRGDEFKIGENFNSMFTRYRMTDDSRQYFETS